MIGGAIIGGALYVLRPSRSVFKVTSRIPVPARQLYEFHLDPTSFYSVLNFSDDAMNSRYTVLHSERQGDRLPYTLSHLMPIFGKTREIRSEIVRSEIEDERMTFAESFTAMRTKFVLRYSFSPDDDDDTATNVCVDIEIAGPALCLRLFRRVPRDFEKRFRITNEHIDDLFGGKKNIN